MIGATIAATPAAAHPSHPPQTVLLSSAGSEVRVRWTAAPGELTELARVLGVGLEPRTFVFDDGELVPGESDASDIELLEQSRQLPAYLLDRIGVRQAGATCPGDVVSVRHLDHDGARLRFDCPERVTDVRVTVSTMSDVDPDSRTIARSAVGGRAVYDSRHPVRAWRLAEPTTAGLGVRGSIAAGVVAALAATVLLVVVRPVRLRRHRAGGGQVAAARTVGRRVTSLGQAIRPGR